MGFLQRHQGADVETAFEAKNNESLERVIFTQPGMRFCQAQVLVYTLIRNHEFQDLPEREKKLITDKIIQDVQGVMLEDIVLMETARTLPQHKRAFKLLFDAGEIDMVVYDSVSDSCELYEVKHSSDQSEFQWKNMKHLRHMNQTERRFGPIVKRTVLYNGESVKCSEGHYYQNVSEYLKEL